MALTPNFLCRTTKKPGLVRIKSIFLRETEENISSNPCGKCSSCLDIAKGSSLDLIELDAASRTGVDDMRELLENAQYLPTKSRFKIYLIDEVHMLSKSSFNALLKTLEEPPSHIKFLFATTDPQKLPITILSRCLQFNLQKIEIKEIEQQLISILKQEKINFEEESIKHIAKAGNGSMRDCLSIMDQIIAYCNNNITQKDVIEILGVVNQVELIKLIDALTKEDATTLLSLTKEMANKGENFLEVLKELMSLFHQLNLIKVSNNDTDKSLFELSQKFSDEALHLNYQIALQGIKDLPFSPNHQIGFEITLLRMITFSNNKTIKKKLKK